MAAAAPSPAVAKSLVAPPTDANSRLSSSAPAGQSAQSPQQQHQSSASASSSSSKVVLGTLVVVLVLFAALSWWMYRKVCLQQKELERATAAWRLSEKRALRDRDVQSIVEDMPEIQMLMEAAATSTEKQAANRASAAQHEQVQNDVSQLKKDRVLDRQAMEQLQKMGGLQSTTTMRRLDELSKQMGLLRQHLISLPNGNPTAAAVAAGTRPPSPYHLTHPAHHTHQTGPFPKGKNQRVIRTRTVTYPSMPSPVLSPPRPLVVRDVEPKDHSSNNSDPRVSATSMDMARGAPLWGEKTREVDEDQAPAAAVEPSSSTAAAALPPPPEVQPQPPATTTTESERPTSFFQAEPPGSSAPPSEVVSQGPTGRHPVAPASTEPPDDCVSEDGCPIPDELPRFRDDMAKTAAALADSGRPPFHTGPRSLTRV